MRHALPALLLLCASALAGCASEEITTQVVLEVDVESQVLARMRDLRVEIYGTSTGGSWQPRLERTVDVHRDDFGGWPATVGITPIDGQPGRVFDVRATALAPDGTVVGQISAVAGFSRGQVRALRLWLRDDCIALADSCDESACRGESCLTCRSGKCEAVGVARALPTYTAVEPMTKEPPAVLPLPGEELPAGPVDPPLPPQPPQPDPEEPCEGDVCECQPVVCDAGCGEIDDGCGGSAACPDTCAAGEECVASADDAGGQCADAETQWLVGEYASRSFSFAEGSGNGGIFTSMFRTLDLNLVTIEATAEGVRVTTKPCYGRSASTNGTDAVEFPLERAAQTPSFSFDMTRADGTWKSGTVEHDVGWQRELPVYCDGTSRTPTDPGAAARPWLPGTCRCPLDTELAEWPRGLADGDDSAADCRLVDDDKNGEPGVTADIETTVGTARLHQIGTAWTEWSLTPEASGRHRGLLGLPRPTETNVQRCESTSVFDLCSTLDASIQPTACDISTGSWELVPAAGLTCGELVAQQSTLFSSAGPAAPDNCR